jgi:hypothetical protein
MAAALAAALATATPGVELEDDLTASLLQARLIELHLPINAEIGMQL